MLNCNVENGKQYFFFPTFAQPKNAPSGNVDPAPTNSIDISPYFFFFLPHEFPHVTVGIGLAQIRILLPVVEVDHCKQRESADRELEGNII